MKYLTILPAALLMAGCAGSPPNDETLTFLSKETGVTGSYHPQHYTAAYVEARVGKEACTSGTLATYEETSGQAPRIGFTAKCDGADAFDSTAGFTLNEASNTGRITGQIDGELVQIKIPDLQAHYKSKQ